MFKLKIACPGKSGTQVEICSVLFYIQLISWIPVAKMRKKVTVTKHDYVLKWSSLYHLLRILPSCLMFQ